MTRAPRRPHALLVAGLLLAGCTGHAEDELDLPAQVSPPPELTDVVIPAPEPVPSNTPSGCVRAGPVTPLRLKPHSGAAGDVTGDGQPDVVALSYVEGAASALVLLEGEADGSFVEGPPQAVEGGGIELGDLDGDGDLDALILDARRKPAYRVALNDGRGSFALGSPHRIPGHFGGELDQASLVDLDDDGDLDAVVPLWDSVRVLSNRGDGSFAAGQRVTVGRDPFSTAVADLDGDGHLDLVTTSGAAIESDRDAYHSAGSSVWFHRGSPRGFARTPDRLALPGASELAVVDLDDDGVLEIAVTRTWGITVLRDPRFWASSKRWPAAPSPSGAWLRDQTEARFKVGTDGPLLVADLGPPAGPELITSSYMQGRINIVGGSPEAETSSVEAGSFVVGLYAAEVSTDGTLPDVVILNAGPPGGVYGEPAPSVSVLFVDCPSP